MIVVIADDFTGAAELAGISLRFGLKVDLFLNDIKKSDADVLVVCTDSRSMRKQEAIEVTKKTVSNAMQLEPSLIYKKTDSVLRGYVLDEILIQMEVAGQKKTFLLPANPSLGRTISNGEYLVDEKKIAETAFANDPEFPVKHSLVKNMLGDDKLEVLGVNDALPNTGIAIGEATSEQDIAYWANALDNSWLLAGAGDFYTALLRKTYSEQEQPAVGLQSPLLYVCGTAFAERKTFIDQINKEKNTVLYMPDIISAGWIKAASEKIKQYGYLIIAIDETGKDALSLRWQMAALVKQLVDENDLQEIFIEGGSTAAAILQSMQINCLQPINELSRGVVRMKSSGLFITVKPGSYPLPEVISKVIYN